MMPSTMRRRWLGPSRSAVSPVPATSRPWLATQPSIARTTVVPTAITRPVAAVIAATVSAGMS